MMDTMELESLESYVGEYSPLAKAYHTQGGLDVFFHDVVKFLLEVACISPQSYCIMKQRVGFIIATYEGEKID